MANNISIELAFHWWVINILRKCDRIIKQVKSGYLRKTYKYGVEVITDIASDIQLDTKNNNSLWMDAIEKEMKHVLRAFQFNDGDKVPICHTKIDVKMIFDIKMITLIRKSHLVAGGHHIDHRK